MANADQVRALIQSHSDGDDARFYAIALQVAARAARSGHSKAAQELKALVEEGRKRQESHTTSQLAAPAPLVQPRGELAGLLEASYPKRRLSSLALPEAIRESLDRILDEQAQRERLRDYGFPPQRKLLLVGPPGTGKTSTAAALACELRLPLFSIRLDALLSKFMGETAAKLRLVFDAVSQTRAVYLFDEIDALGTERGRGHDVGEIRRVLNSFLQLLEQDRSDSLLVGATNLPETLDKALFRRFDAVLDYPLPSAALAELVMRNRLALLDTGDISWPDVVEASAGLSHAEMTLACEYAAKSAILRHETRLGTCDLADALRSRRAVQRD